MSIPAWDCPGLFSISYSCNVTFITAATRNELLLLPRPLCHPPGAGEALETRKA